MISFWSVLWENKIFINVYCSELVLLLPESFFAFENLKKYIDRKNKVSYWPAPKPGNMCNTPLNKWDLYITLCLQGDLLDGQVGRYMYRPNVGKDILKLITI